MGLDIYLRRYENFEDTQKKEKKYEKQSEKNWYFDGKKYEELTDEEKESARQKDKELKISLSLDEYGSGSQSISEDHQKYPEHLFKIGYFRSSYNESGIERKLETMGLNTLHDIFDPQDKYEFQPDWEKALVKTENVIKELQKLIDEGNNYGCFKFFYNDFLGDPNDFKMDSEEKALEMFLEEKNKIKTFDNYSNSTGEFFFAKPFEISALINGVNQRLLTKEKLPCTYVIYKDDGFNWYIQALEIVRDTIKYVLLRADKDKYYLAWSS
jgi:hypothetical protein